jgi:predicted metal-dependent hydrolase
LLGRLRSAFGPRPEAPEHFHVDVEDLRVAVTRKRVRNFSLRVLWPSGELRLSVPKRSSQRALLSFLHERVGWMRRQRERILAQAALTPAPASREEKAAARRQLEGALEPLIRAWEARLGLKVRRWGLRVMHSRWGSCNPRTATLSFSLSLAAREAEVLEYLVVHEMLHLIEAGHGARFKALLEQYYPNWKSARATLNGKKLEGENPGSGRQAFFIPEKSYKD